MGYRPITAQQNLLRTPLVRAKLTRVASINSPDQVGIARLVPLAEEGGLQGFAEGGELGKDSASGEVRV